MPDLLKWSGTYHFQEMLDLFDIYLQWDTDKVRALFKASPWMMAQTLNQLEAYLRLFKMYKFDRDVLYEVVGCPPLHSFPSCSKMEAYSGTLRASSASPSDC